MTNDGYKHNDVSRQALDNKHKENSREGKEKGRFARTGRHCLQQLLHLSSADGLASAAQRRQPVRSGVISPQRRETYLTPCTKTAAGSSTFWISQMIDETASRQLHVCFPCVCPEPALANFRFIPMRSRRIRKDQKTARKKRILIRVAMEKNAYRRSLPGRRPPPRHMVARSRVPAQNIFVLSAFSVSVPSLPWQSDHF